MNEHHGKTFFELQASLVELQESLGKQADSTMLDGIKKSIANVKALIEEYDLSDDDLFACNHCCGVFDIEESITHDGGLICENCHEELV